MKASVLVSFSSIAVTKSASLAEIAERVNAGNYGWKAEAPAKFSSVDDVKPYLGAFLPGDPEYYEADVEEVIVNDILPESFDSSAQWPQCSVIGNVRDQSACGTCWAFASVSSFESRACIATGKDIKYSPMDTGFCSNAGNGCRGGNTAWSWFKSHGVVTGGDYPDLGSGSSCMAYTFKPCAHHVPASEKYDTCPTKEYSAHCKAECEDGYGSDYAQDKIGALTSYSVRGVTQIQQDLINNGPLYVAFTVYDDFPTYKSGVYQHTSRKQLGGHAVTMVGWGTLDGQDYWRIKNSWNEQWGDNGHFLIRRGHNECGIESSAGAGKVDGSPAPPSPPPPPPPAGCPGQDDEAGCEALDNCEWCDHGIFAGTCADSASHVWQCPPGTPASVVV